MKKLFLLFFISGVLYGCNANSIKPDYQFSNTNEKGIILVSITQDRGKGYSIFYIDHKNGGRFTLLKARERTAFGYDQSEFPNVNGKLFALEAPIGTYIISSWQINNGTGAWIRPKKDPEEIKFKVNKGEVVYIGNLHMKLQTGENLLGISITGGGYPLINGRLRKLLLERIISAPVFF